MSFLRNGVTEKFLRSLPEFTLSKRNDRDKIATGYALAMTEEGAGQGFLLSPSRCSGLRVTEMTRSGRDDKEESK